MLSCPCRVSSLLIGAALLGATVKLQAAPWYGSACPATSISVLPIPAAPRLQLLLVRRSPLDAGDSINVLVTPDGQFWVERENFLAWNLPPPTAIPQHFEEADWYSLEQVRGLNYRFDACTQELWMDVSGVQGVRNSFNVNTNGNSSWTEVTEPGGHLNFDLLYLNASGEGQVSGTAELGAFSPQGHGISSLLYNGSQAIRLETQWTHDWPDRAERLTLGDSITSGGQVGQALRFGGLQWGTEFSLQPDRVTFPLPSLRGRAALPSTVDVYVNQVLRAQQDVPAGSFELNNVPVVTGSGNVQLVVRDLLGRNQVINYPFYASPALLRAGLHDYSLQVGALRENFGYRSGNYGAGFGAGRLRSGLTDELSSEIYAEASSQQQMAGAGLSGIALPVGSWNVGFATSHGAQGFGVLGNFGVEHMDNGWNTALQIKLATSEFAQLGEPAGTLRTQMLARLGFVAGQGNIDFSYLSDQRRDRGSSSILAANYVTRLRRDWYLNAGLTRIIGSGTAATLALTHPFGGDKTVSIQEAQGPDSQMLHRLSVQRDPPSALGVAYRLAAEQGSNARTTGNLRWSSEKGNATLDGENLNGDNSIRLGVSSGLALLGRDWFWTRPVDSSFVVVDSGAPDVRIYQDNHLTGRADQDGLLLVPGLRAFEQNVLRVEDADLPLRYSAQSLTVTVVPPVLSGVRARFAVENAISVSIYLTQLNGMPVPVGSMVELDGQPLDLPVGYGGQILVEAAPGTHQLRLRWRQKQCATLLLIAPDAGADTPPQSLECH